MILLIFLVITMALLPAVFAGELQRLLERNRGLVVKLDDEDFGRVSHLTRKYECHSMFSRYMLCPGLTGAGFEQVFTTSHSPPHPPLATPQPSAFTEHRTTNNDNTSTMDIITTALIRQHIAQTASLSSSSLPSPSVPALSDAMGALNPPDPSTSPIIEAFLTGSAPTKSPQPLPASTSAKERQSNILDDKHDSLIHVKLNKRAKFSATITPTFPRDVTKPPSHSKEYLAKLLGQYERLRAQKQTQAPTPTKPTGQIMSTLHDDGSMVISAEIPSVNLADTAMMSDDEFDVYLASARDDLEVQLRNSFRDRQLGDDLIDSMMGGVLDQAEAQLRAARKKTAEQLGSVSGKTTPTSATISQSGAQNISPSEDISSTSTQATQQGTQTDLKKALSSGQDLAEFLSSNKIADLESFDEEDLAVVQNYLNEFASTPEGQAMLTEMIQKGQLTVVQLGDEDDHTDDSH